MRNCRVIIIAPNYVIPKKTMIYCSTNKSIFILIVITALCTTNGRSNKFPYEYDDYNELLWLSSNHNGYGIQHSIHPWDIQNIYETRIAQTTSTTPTTTATTASTIPTLSSGTFLKTGFKSKKLKKRQDFAIDTQLGLAVIGFVSLTVTALAYYANRVRIQSNENQINSLRTTISDLDTILSRTCNKVGEITNVELPATGTSGRLRTYNTNLDAISTASCTA